jgi:nitrogen fixation protein NifU and related proteins
MPTLIDATMMRQVIMDHYEHPRNKRIPNSQEYLSVHLDTIGCVDDIHVALKWQGDKIEDVLFHGVACTISTASTSIMTELLVNKTKQEALYIIDQYIKMIHEIPYDDSVLGDAMVFKNTYKQAARIKCATLGWVGAQQLISKEE